MDRKQLETQFHEAMVGIYLECRKLKPRLDARKFFQMVNSMGGKACADKLLAMDEPSDGFADLRVHSKEALKLSVEYVVLKNPWHQLFEPEQLAIARRRLQEVQCELPPEHLATQSEKRKRTGNPFLPVSVVLWPVNSGLGTFSGEVRYERAGAGLA